MIVTMVGHMTRGASFDAQTKPKGLCEPLKSLKVLGLHEDSKAV